MSPEELNSHESDSKREIFQRYQFQWVTTVYRQSSPGLSGYSLQSNQQNLQRATACAQRWEKALKIFPSPFIAS